MPIQKILLVDDSKTELHHLSELLGKRGFEVRTAENGEDAMKRLPARSLTQLEHLADLGVAVVEHLMQQKHGSLSRIQALE